MSDFSDDAQRQYGEALANDWIAPQPPNKKPLSTDEQIESLWFAAQKYVDLDYDGSVHQLPKEKWEAKAKALLDEARREELKYVQAHAFYRDGTWLVCEERIATLKSEGSKE